MTATFNIMDAFSPTVKVASVMNADRNYNIIINLYNVVYFSITLYSTLGRS